MDNPHTSTIYRKSRKRPMFVLVRQTKLMFNTSMLAERPASLGEHVPSDTWYRLTVQTPAFKDLGRMWLDDWTLWDRWLAPFLLVVSRNSLFSKSLKASQLFDLVLHDPHPAPIRTRPPGEVTRRRTPHLYRCDRPEQVKLPRRDPKPNPDS